MKLRHEGIVFSKYERGRRASGHGDVLMKRFRSVIVLFIALGPTTGCVLPVRAQGPATIEIKDLRPDELRVLAFRVVRSTTTQLSAVGGQHKHSDQMFAYPWMLNAETRELVWSMADDPDVESSRKSYLGEVKKEFKLKPGTYELYFFAGRPRVYGNNIQIDGASDLKEFLKDILGGGERYSDRDLAEQMYVRLTGDTGAFEKLSAPPGPPVAAVELAPAGGDEYRHQGFVLSKPVELNVYAAGEYSEWSEVMVDWGWIVNAANRERVWEMNRWNSEVGGGADKNRVARETINLPAGEYIAYYVTDDSHSYGNWNDIPPYDPEAWGLRIRAAKPADAGAIRAASVEFSEKPIIQMIGVCDNELLSKGFRLKSPADLHVYAIGEYDRFGDRMADYGWISDAKSGERVWAMDGDNTQFAGGAAKNRMFDGVITLDAGEYVVHYVTDGSHSHCSWNSSPPYDQANYGIAISLRGKTAQQGVATVFEPSAGPIGALAALTCVHDNERRSAKFTLEKVTRVKIHAVGEGNRDEMFDYGWIENSADGSIVWEMTYRKTMPAGGAEKNRMVDQTILLDKGTYVVYFVTDGSHSCNNWNDDPPDDPLPWGIVITEAAK